MKCNEGLRVILAGIVVLASALGVGAADVDLSRLPPPTEAIVDFERDIRPIFETSCLRCHGPEKPRSRLRLDNRESAFKGGRHGAVILPGLSAKSSLVLYVARLVEDMEMPPNGKGDPLTRQQIALLRGWIDQGAVWPESSLASQSQLAISATSGGGWVGVHGNQAKFREQGGIKNGATGGVQSFSLTQIIDSDTRFTMEGRALYDANDYRVKLALERNEVGFIRGGFEEWRKYFNDVGGYYALLNPPAYSVGRNLHEDLGRAWFELGLTLPDWPKMTLGYEYQFKSGAESTLQWGPVGAPGFAFPGTDARNIYPAFKTLDERVQILKFDLEHDLLGWHIEDSFRYEFYSLKNSSDDVMQYTVGPMPDNLTRETEYDQQRMGANSFRLERQFVDWFQASGGYYYSGIRGEASFTDQTLSGANALVFGPQYFGNNIILKQDTHAFSASGLLGPWQGLAFSTAVQSEWTRQEGFGNPNLQVGNPAVPLLFSDPISLMASLAKFTVSEELALRYTAIPHTVVFAESRFQQVEIRQFQDQDGSFAPFTRDTAASEDLKEASAGFTVSPWQPVSFTASFRHSARRSDFDHLIDQSPGIFAYPAFIRWRDITSNEASAKLVLRPCPWFRATLGYALGATDYTTATASFPGVTPGGAIYSGNDDAQTYSLGMTLTPWKRLFFTDTLSYADTRLSTENAGNGAAFVVPSRGGVYSALSSASFVLNDTTDLTASYSFSHSDFGQNDLVAGLPAGTIYTRHGVEVGIRHRFRPNLSSSLLYTFYHYREPSSGTVNDYVAHGIFATVTMTWP